MNRRQLVAGLGGTILGTVSGCSAFRSADSDQPFRFEASLVNVNPTADRPPIIQIEVTNTGDNSHTLTISNQSLPFATSQATTSGSTLILEREIPDSRNSNCWIGIPRGLPAVDSREFTSDESVTAKYAVLNAEENNVCWPAKTFNFTESYYVDTNTPNNSEQDAQFEWGLSVTVRENSSITIQDRETTTAK